MLVVVKVEVVVGFRICKGVIDACVATVKWDNVLSVQRAVGRDDAQVELLSFSNRYGRCPCQGSKQKNK